MSGKDGNHAASRRKVPPTVLGWAVRVLSIAVLLVLAFALGREVLAPSLPPEITLTPDWSRARETNDPSVRIIPVAVTNQGTTPAANVLIAIDRPGMENLEVSLELLGAKEEVMLDLRMPVSETSLSYEVRSLQRF